MAKDKIQVKFEKPRVRFSESGAPYTLVEDIFHSERGQKIISRMALLRARESRADRAPQNRHGQED
jgi:hypothetical protein